MSVSLVSFSAIVDRYGYNDFLAAFQDEAPNTVVMKCIDSEVPESLATLLLLFYLGNTIPRVQVASVLGADHVDLLISIGILEANDTAIRSTVRLQYIAGLTFFVGFPSIRFPLYFGEDSLGLLRRQRSRPGRRALDLCTGTGVQAMRLASMGADAVGVDLNPFAIRIARLNAEMNGLSDRLDFRAGDLWGAVKDGERFDWVSCNPPLLPTFAEGNYPLIGDGGDDGMSIVWRILDNLEERLTDEGQAVVLGETWSDGIMPLCFDRLAEMSRRTSLTATMTVIRTFPAGVGTTWHNGMVETYAIHSETPREDASRGLERVMTSLGATHVVSYFLNVRRGGVPGLIDLSPFPSGRIWEV